MQVYNKAQAQATVAISISYTIHCIHIKLHELEVYLYSQQVVVIYLPT